MKLKVYDNTDLTGRAELKRAGLKIYKTQIVLYPELLTLLNAGLGYRVKFSQDSERPNDWYICVDNENGVLIRKYGKSNAFSCILGLVSKTVPEHWHKQMILVGNQPVEVDGLKWYPLITAGLNEVPTIVKKQERTERFDLDTARKQY